MFREFFALERRVFCRAGHVCLVVRQIPRGTAQAARNRAMSLLNHMLTARRASKICSGAQPASEHGSAL